VDERWSARGHREAYGQALVQAVVAEAEYLCTSGVGCRGHAATRGKDTGTKSTRRAAHVLCLELVLKKLEKKRTRHRGFAPVTTGQLEMTALQTTSSTDNMRDALLDWP
jgi:hypothetical protein